MKQVFRILATILLTVFIFVQTTEKSSCQSANNTASVIYIDEPGYQYEELLMSAGSKVKDIDGNVYNTVKIGTQVWMAENLKTTKYNDGTDIPLVTEISEWNRLNTPAYCWYNNDRATYGNTYGALYNWHTVNTGKLCPAGWRVPTEDDWTTLATYLGDISVAGSKLKESGTTNWNSPNTDATNRSGFTGLPGGNRRSNGNFRSIGYNGYWWSSTEEPISGHARYMNLYYENSNVYISEFHKRNGFSVRCIKN